MNFILLTQQGEKQIPTDKVDEQGLPITRTILVESELILPLSCITKITMENVTDKETNESQKVLVIETNYKEEYDAEDFARNANGEVKFTDVKVFDEEKKKSFTKKEPIRCVVRKTKNITHMFNSEKMINYYETVLKQLV